MSKRTLRISAKCSDMFRAVLSEEGKPTREHDGYVPSWLANSSSNYVHMTIDLDTGAIVDWSPPSEEALENTFPYEN